MPPFRVTALACVALFLSVPVGNAHGQRVAKVALNPHELSETTQHGYAQIVVVAAEECGLSTSHEHVGVSQAGSNAFESQVDRAFRNLTIALAAAGATHADVVKITPLIKDHAPVRLSHIGKKRREFLGRRFLSGR